MYRRDHDTLGMAVRQVQCCRGREGAGTLKKYRLCSTPEKDYEGVISTVNYGGAAARCVNQFKYIHRARMGILMGKVIRE